MNPRLLDGLNASIVMIETTTLKMLLINLISNFELVHFKLNLAPLAS